MSLTGEPTGQLDSGAYGRRVLVVDDDRNVRSIATTLLQHLGYETMTADCGEVALQLLAAHESEIGLVILDLTMPQMGGDEVFFALRQRNHAVPVLLSSGHNADYARDQIGDETASFIQKPYRLAELREAVAALVSPR